MKLSITKIIYYLLKLPIIYFHYTYCTIKFFMMVPSIIVETAFLYLEGDLLPYWLQISHHQFPQAGEVTSKISASTWAEPL